MNFDKIATDIVGRIICQPQNGAKLASLLSSVRLVELTVYALFYPRKMRHFTQVAHQCRPMMEQ